MPSPPGSSGPPVASAWSASVRSTPVGTELSRLLETRRTASLTDVELADALTARRRLANQNEAEQLRLAEELHRRREAEDPDTDHTGPRHRAEVAACVGMELRVAWSQTRNRAEQRLHLARALADELPRTCALLTDGRIDEYAAQIIANELTRISDPGLVAVAEEVLLDRLGVDGGPVTALVASDTTKIGRLARLTLAEADPAAFDERFNRAHAGRRVTRQGEGDGMARLTLTHTSVDVEAIHHRLTMIAIGLGTGDPRTLDQRRADIAVDLLIGRIAVDSSTAELEADQPPRIRVHEDGGPRAQVNVTVPIQSLMGVSDDPGILPGGEPIPASLARQIASDPGSVWYRLLTDPAGNILDLSTHGYRPGAALVRAVDARDQTSVAPGSSTPASGCDHDHQVPYPRGQTSYVNTGLLARSDHVIRHSPGFTIEQTAPGVFEWTMPTGHTWTRRPPPQPVGHWPADWRQPVSVQQVQDGLVALERQHTMAVRARVAAARRRIAEARLHRWEREHADPTASGPVDDADVTDADLNEADYEMLASLTEEMLADW